MSNLTINKYIEQLKKIALIISKDYRNNIKIEINVEWEKEEVKINVSAFDL